MSNRTEETRSGHTRRDFLMAAAGAPMLAMAANLAAQETTSTDTQTSAAQPGYVIGKETIKVGLIGSGGRGTGAAENCVMSTQDVVITAMGDLFQDRIDTATKNLKEKLGPKFLATPETSFTGFDAYKKVLECDVDLVILATPPGFRPIHLRAAVEAGKHVFMEKPVCVDPIGARSVIESGEIAAKKGLGIVCGTQRRHDPIYLETIKRIQDGAIGDVVSGECYWMQEGLWFKERKSGMSEMEWQCRNWLYFDWLSGDHIVEQHVHNIDVMNWVMGGPPESALGMGGRAARTEPVYGNIFDHFAIEFEYANGVRIQSMCRQTPTATGRVSEFVVGSKGTANPFGEIKGPNPWKWESETKINPYEKEHADLIKSIRDGKPLNEAKRIAESTLTAIMGRMSAYTGRQVSWKWVLNSSKLDLTPAKFDFVNNPVNAVPIPGFTQLV